VHGWHPAAVSTDGAPGLEVARALPGLGPFQMRKFFHANGRSIG
jgi:hypothetical protein